MKILIIGSGGREHAIGIKIFEQNKNAKIYFAPGNGGTWQIGENVNLDLLDHQTVINFCSQKEIELVIVGPEQPLVDGIADDLRNEGINVFGPSKNAARIEGDKSFAKSLMNKYNVPTAIHKTFNSSEIENAVKYLREGKFPIVIKASGLAAGKGVIIANNFSEAETAIYDIMKNSIFGEAGEKVVIEEFLEGEELSVFVVTDGKNFIILPPAQDHKRIGEGDTGKNTGGMGAYSPISFVDDILIEEIKSKVIIPTLNGLENCNSQFNGCLYCGLINTSDGIKVIEFNCRFGDPETQAVLQLIDGDFLSLLNSAAKGKIIKESVKYNGGSAICVVVASGGYPDNYEKGFEIFGLKEKFDDNIKIIHAGTKLQNGKMLTSGGRVLNIVSSIKQNDLKYCITKAYEVLDKVKFDKMYFRKDIGFKAIN
ncbi:MAG: phosphoribosylamine--glycine ligase [Ignavibacteriae bacterium]|nr:phosphoribosylamine--glycine ligase [Ignavibacteriota bacterium]